MLLALPGVAFAQYQEPRQEPREFVTTASADLQYYSNLFHLPSSAAVEAQTGETDRSDLVLASTLGFRLDKKYSRQQILGNATYTYNSFERFSYFNGSETNADLSWIYQITPWFSGRLIGRQQQGLSDFDYYRTVNKKNYFTRRFAKAETDFNPFSGWHVLANTGISSGYRTNNTLGETPKSLSQSFGGGIAYESLAHNRIEATASRVRGAFGSSSASIFSSGRHFRDEVYNLEYKTAQNGEPFSTDFNIGYFERTHESYKERDVSGLVSDGFANWELTQKFSVNLKVLRQIGAYQDQYFTSLKRTDTNLGVKWKLSYRTSVGASYGYTWIDFGGTSSVDEPESRKDEIRAFTVNANWQPRNFFGLQLQAGSRSRDSTFQPIDLDYHGYMVSLTTLFAF